MLLSKRCITLCLCLFVVCRAEAQTVDTKKPPKAQKGDPVLFPKALNLSRWKERTKPGFHGSFVETSEGSYVDWDWERKPFTIIVVHHSVVVPDDLKAETVTKFRQSLSRGALKRLYEPVYDSDQQAEPYVKGLDIHSGHVIDDRETFVGYHHLVFADGMVTTELSSLIKIDDIWYVDHIGWHAGNWSVNCESIGICLVGDFSKKQPTEKQIRALAGLVVYYKQYNEKLLLKTHKEVRKRPTACPGDTWLIWGKSVRELTDVPE